MRNLIIVLFCICCLTLAYGFYLRYFTEDLVAGDRFLGLTILAVSFIVMPLFLYHRWKDRKVKDYMLDEDNIRRMREFNDSKESRKKPENQ